VSALIVPNYKLVEEYAKEKGLKYNGREELLKNEKVCALFKARIDTLQQQFSHYEQIKRFTLLPHSFSVEKGELTNTLKIKRNVLNEHYADEINKMYEE
jgi:long-chain acyl-CoA synthetase